MPAQYDVVATRDEGAVRIIEMNRPEALNAFNQQMFDDLCDAFLAAAADSAVKVVLLTGRGRAFSAGADLKAMGTDQGTPKHTFAGFCDILLDLDKPLVLAVNGLGVGVGVTMFGLADLVFIAEGAKVKCPFSALGLTAEAGSTYLFPQLMGRQKAAWLLLSAEWMSAAECVETGLALASAPDDELLATALARASTLAALPSASVTMTKRLMMDPHREQLRAVFKAENMGLAELQGGPALREALTAFAEKRAPDFAGL